MNSIDNEISTNIVGSRLKFSNPLIRVHMYVCIICTNIDDLLLQVNEILFVDS